MEVPPSPESSTATSMVFQPKKFLILISYKLNDDNFLLWKQEALATIIGHHLQSHLCKDHIPKMHLSNSDALVDKYNPEFSDWEHQDNILLTWLLASLSDSIRV